MSAANARVGALLLGLMVHMDMSVLFGVILAALVGRLPAHRGLGRQLPA